MKSDSAGETRIHGIPVVVSIAGSDPSAGAGIQADLKTFAALGVYGMSVVSMLTAQNYREVQVIEPVSAVMLEAQFRSIFDAYQVAAVKIGMVGDLNISSLLGKLLEEYRPEHVVLDPVIRSSSGGALSRTAHPPCMLFEPLLPWIKLITPNVQEAASLLGCPPPKEESEMELLLLELERLGCQAVLLKGGHGCDPQYCHDRLRTDNQTFTFKHARIDTEHLHGTGCTLSSAIASFLAKGNSLIESVKKAIEFTQQAITLSYRIGIAPTNGPLNHFLV